MSVSGSKCDIKSGCHILTQYPVEEFTITWHITNFSKVFNTVHAQFSTSSDSTKWELRLKGCKIQLSRCFPGEPVDIYYTCILFTNEGALQSNGHCRFDRIRGPSDDDIMIFSKKEIVFKDDLFKFKCTLTILGYTTTSNIKSVDVGMTNLNQLSNDLKDLFEKQEHCDLTVSVGQDQIKVHKSILCGRSPVFSKMFECSMLEADKKEIQIKDIELDVLRDFFTFLYSGELGELSWDKALSLYYVADKYEVMSLRKTCSEFLEFNLEVDKVCEALKLAAMHKDEKLKDSVIAYGQMHASALRSTEEWQELLDSHPKLAIMIVK